MIDELYASAERSPLSSMMVRLASVFLKAVALLLLVERRHFFLRDFIPTKPLERFGFSWTIFGHKW